MRADDLPEESIRCRTTGHRWLPSTASRITGGFDVWETCEVCHAERHTDMSNRGTVRSRRIVYPDTYLMPKGSARLEPADRDRLRLLVFNWDYADRITTAPRRHLEAV